MWQVRTRANSSEVTRITEITRCRRPRVTRGARAQIEAAIGATPGGQAKRIPPKGAVTGITAAALTGAVHFELISCFLAKFQ